MRLVPMKKAGHLYPMLSMFDDFVDRHYAADRRKDGIMAMDIREKSDEYVIEANLPGIPKENISITTDKNQLIIEARQEEQKEETKDGEVIYAERYSGSYRRSVLLPEGCQPEDIRARMENGILTLNVPKCRDRAKREIVIE